MPLLHYKSLHSLVRKSGKFNTQIKPIFFSTLQNSSHSIPSSLDKLDFNCGQAAYAVSLFTVLALATFYSL